MKAPSLYPHRKTEHALMVELCSAVERGLNYMHTGNAAVITSSVMTPLWIGRALVEDGFPCLNPKIVRIVNGLRIKADAREWPLLTRGIRPHSCSKASQVFRYSENHFSVSFIIFIHLLR
jgi:hypothetical protein